MVGHASLAPALRASALMLRVLEYGLKIKLEFENIGFMVSMSLSL